MDAKSAANQYRYQAGELRKLGPFNIDALPDHARTSVERRFTAMDSIVRKLRQNDFGAVAELLIVEAKLRARGRHAAARGCVEAVDSILQHRVNESRTWRRLPGDL